MSSKTTACIVSLALGAASASFGATLHVGTLGNDANDGSAGAPFATIDAATAAASDGDTILVGSGYYDHFRVVRARLTIEGGYDTNTWTVASPAAPTVVGDSGWGVAVWFNTAVENTTLRRLTITNPTSNWPGVRFNAACVLTTFDQCVITNCQEGVVNQGNHSPQSWTFTDCLVADNRGDGIAYNNSNIGGATIGTLTISNCTIAGNGGNGVTSNTGNPDHNDSLGVVTDTIFAYNKGAGYHKKGMLPGTTIDHSLFHANGRGAVLEHFAPATLTDCIEGAPCFVDRASGDYRIGAGSAARGTGTGGGDIGCFAGSGAGAPAALSLAFVSAATGSDTAGDGSASAPFATIAFALGRLAPGGEIRVAGGTYAGDVISLCCGKSGITVRGAYDPADWIYKPASQTTEIVSSGYSPVSLASGIAGTRLVSLTLRGGTTYNNAGVLFAGYGCDADIESCRILSNYYGILFDSNNAGSAVLRNTVIAGSSSHAVYVERFGAGAGFSVRYYNCVVANNGGSGQWYGGNPDWGDIVPVAKNSIFAFNGGYGLGKGGAYGGASMENCLFYGNATGPYYDGGNSKIVSLGGNQSGVDPLFADAANRDYSLLSGSPALGTGADLSAADYPVATDIAGAARPDGGWDLGVYESALSGATYLPAAYVDAASGDDSTADGTPAHPFATLAAAMSRIDKGGVVRVAGGVYQGSVSISETRAGVTVEGAYDPSDWAVDIAGQTTVVTPDSANASVVTILTGSNSNVLRRLTLTGATAYGKAAIEFQGSAPRLLVDSCILTGNSYGLYSGVGMGQDVEMRNCLVARNTHGGVMYYLRTGGGGSAGVHAFLNCTVADNGGSGFECSGNNDWSGISPLCVNTIFANNTGYGVKRIGQAQFGVVSNCLFYGNGSGDWASNNGGFSAAVDNQLGKAPDFTDAANGDYTILATSFAAANGADISGAPYFLDTDINGAPRPQNGWDIGCHETAGTAVVLLAEEAFVSATTGSDTDGDGTAAAPYATVAKAFATLSPSGTVHIAGGTYSEAIVIAADRVNSTIAGGYNPADWTLDPAAYPTFVTTPGVSPLSIAEGANSNTFSHLVLQGGTGNPGAGVYLGGSVDGLVVEGCVMANNRYGFYCPSSKAVNATLRNCVVARNQSYGIYFDSWCSGAFAVENCTIADNGDCGYRTQANHEWGTVVPTFRNCIFSGNGNFGIEKRGSSGMATIDRCVFFGNAAGPTCEDADWGIDLVSSKDGRDPLFANAAALDYSVLSGSPAIAYGANLAAASGFAVDILGNARPASGAWTAGAYESSGSAEPALADVVHVATGGSDSTGDGSAAAPFATVDRAIGYVANGGLVKIAGGTYVGRVHVGGEKQGVTVQGGYDPATWTFDPKDQTTVLYDDQDISTFTFHAGAGSNTVSHVTITGTNSRQWLNPACVEIFGKSFGNVLDSCRLTGRRYGLASLKYDVRVYITLVNCLVAGNASHGVYFQSNSDYNYGRSRFGICRLVNCTVADNGGHGILCGQDPGGAPDRDYVEPICVNTIFANNGGYGVYKCNYGRGESPDNLNMQGSIASCLFYGNVSGDFFQYLEDRGGNLFAEAAADPQFTSLDPADPYGIPETSPAVNAGTNSLVETDMWLSNPRTRVYVFYTNTLSELGVSADILGNRRPTRRLYDIGAYELKVTEGTMLILR